MPRITFGVGVTGTADVTRALQGLSAVMKQLFTEMKSESAKAATAAVAQQRKTVEGERHAMMQRKAVLQQTYRDWVKTESELTVATAKGVKDREALVAKEAAARKRYQAAMKADAGGIEKEWTRIVIEESAKRDRAYQSTAEKQEARANRQRQREAEAWARTTRAHDALAARDQAQEAREQRAVARTQTREANASRGRFAGAFVGGLRAVASAGSAYAQDMHGQYQDARRQRAQTAESLVGSLTQVGANRADVQAAMGLVTAQARAHGMTSEQLASAVSGAQTEFSVLGTREQYAGMSAGDRSAAILGRLRETLGSAVQGRNLGSDPAEFTRLSGMFRQQGLSSDTTQQLLARTVAMAQQGSVEAGSVTRSAMTPILRRMQQAQTALPDNATQPEREAAMQRAYIDSFAEMQVMRQRGYNPRLTGQNMANMNQALSGDVTAEKMRTNLRVAQHGARGELRKSLDTLLGTGDGGLFEADPAQPNRTRLRDAYRGNALALAQHLHEGGLDPTLMSNLLAGGGHGNPQSVQRNWGNILNSLSSTNAEGITGYAAIQHLTGATLSQGEQTQMADVYENSPMAELNRNEERRLSALTDNTDSLKRMSDRFADWTAAHPSASAGLNAGFTLGTGAVGWGLNQMIRSAGGSAAGAAAGVAGQSAAAGVVSGASGAFTAAGATLGATLGTALVSAVGGLALGEMLNRAIYSDADRHQSTTGGDTSILSGTTWQGAWQGLHDVWDAVGPAENHEATAKRLAMANQTPSAAGANDYSDPAKAAWRNTSAPATIDPAAATIIAEAIAAKIQNLQVTVNPQDAAHAAAENDVTHRPSAGRDMS